MVILTFLMLQRSRAAICSVLAPTDVLSSLSQSRPRAIAVITLARASARIGRGRSPFERQAGCNHMIAQ